MIRKLAFVLLICIGMIVLANPPKAPKGKVWILNPLMSDEFGPDGFNPNVFNIYGKDRSWGRTAAFDPKAIRAEQDPDSEGNYFLTMNPLWYYEDEVWHSDKLDRTFTFAGGAMDTKNLQTYGYFEVRIRPSDFPMGSGVFMNSRGNPATECLKKYSTELDMIENMGYTGPGAGEMGTRGGFFNYVQHVNSHTKDLKYVDDQGNCVQYDGWDAWDSTGADHYTLDDPHAFFTVGMWWANDSTVSFYNNDRKFSSLVPSRKYGIPMALILSMETYITGCNEENNAGNPKPQEWMWEPDFRTKDQRAVKYDWVRTWKLVDVDPLEFNEETDNVMPYGEVLDVYKGDNITGTLIYSASETRTVKAMLLSPSNEVLAETVFTVEKGVSSQAFELPSDAVTEDSDAYSIKFTIEDESSVLQTSSVQLSISVKPLTKALYLDGIPTALEPASSIDLNIHYEADTTCKIVVEVHEPNGDGLVWIAQVVEAGRGVAEYDIELSSPLEYGSDYYFRIYMFRNGKNWQDPQSVNLGNIYFNVEDSWDASLEIQKINEIDVSDEEIEVEFAYATKADGKLSIVLLDKDDKVVASKYRDERYGKRTLTRTMTVDSKLVADDSYKAVVTYTPNNPAYETLSDTVDNIKVGDKMIGIADVIDGSANDDIKIYPNPTAGLVYITPNKPIGEIKSIEVFDIAGSRVLMKTHDIKSGTLELDISALENDTYVLRIITEDKTYIKKLIKH